MAEVEPPLHNTWPATGFTTGVGFTVMVKLTGTPVQVVPPLVAVGVTVMVATTGAVPVLVAVNVPILPVPPEARPIDGWEFVQLYVVPVPVKVTAVVGLPLHTCWLSSASAVGSALTVVVYVAGESAVHPDIFV
jgi:hypothetical protein